MGSHAVSEELEEDERGFLAAAREEDALAAELLMRLARSEPPAAKEEPLKWATQRPRSRCITMAGVLSARMEDAAGRGSPTTPLSWSGGGGGGGSGTSGSVCGDGGPSDSVPPPKRMKTETAYEDGEAEPAAAVGSSSGSSKPLAVPEPPKRVEPLRLRWTGEGTASVVIRRPGKKKTLPELKALTESLLREQVELRKEVEKQKKILETLLEKNVKLRTLESSLPSRTIGESGKLLHAQPCSGSKTAKEQRTEQDQPGQLQCTRSSPSAPRRGLLLDLNCPPVDDL